MSFGFCSIVFYIFLSLLTHGSEAQQNFKSPATEFRRHRIVQPVLHHGRTKREITSTRHKEGFHHPHVTMTLNIDGENNILDLTLNEALIAQGYTISYQKNGSTVTYQPSIEELDICQYSGKVRGKEDSWVALSTCHGVRGVIRDGNQMRYIEPARAVDVELGSKHFVYDHSDLTTHYPCGYGSGGNKNNTNNYIEHLKKKELSKEWNRSNRYKRDFSSGRCFFCSSLDTEVRGPHNANTKSRFVELVLVADNAVYKANGENIKAVYAQLQDATNIMNSLYAPLNIFIALVGVEIWTEQNKINLVEDGDATLTNFLTYRRDELNIQIPNDNAQLLTMQVLSDGVVEKFLKGPICSAQYSGGVIVNHSTVIGLIGMHMAHGLGHNFGMEHDGSECHCPNDTCIMTPVVNVNPSTQWSDCSRNQLAFSFKHGMDHCLRNKPKRLFESPLCGNGFVEPGEQCDCGLRADFACAACCDPGACVLRGNATCASGECCDPLTCQMLTVGSMCRVADDECDLPEYCSGQSAFCPKDVHKMDSTPCSENQAYCAGGLCRTHASQCQLLWGSTGSNAAAMCYESNVEGDRTRNCGFTRAAGNEYQQYLRCGPEDVLCGRLHCEHHNEHLEYGLESVSMLSLLVIKTNGTLTHCRTAVIDMGTQDADPGMVPDGANCGKDKMCWKQKCLPVDDVRLEVAAQATYECPTNCSEHGVCNSEGRCHCDAGYAPPYCVLPQFGGSIDSGQWLQPDPQTKEKI